MKNKQDARRLDHKTLTELRKRAVSSVQGGESPEVVARALGISRVAMYKWLAKYRQGGWDALDAKKRGGRPPKLDGKAIRWVYHTVTTKDPRQMRFPFALWTTAMVAQLIWERLKIRLSRSSVSRLLTQLGLSAQRPLWRAYQQNPEVVDRWLKEEYPKIRALAAGYKAEIYFCDEAGVRSDFHAGTTWGVRGKTPVVSSTGARFGLNLISAVNPRGEMRFMVVKGCVGAKVFIEFIKRLIHGAKGIIFLIVDGHPAHRAKMVKNYVDTIGDRFRLFFLPPYSPELNPDELVWNDLKNQAIGRKVITDALQLKKEVLSHMRFLQKSPHLIRSFFQSPTTAYAC
jgi:transposase